MTREINKLFYAFLLPVFISECMQVGPSMVTRDQFHYAATGDARD